MKEGELREQVKQLRRWLRESRFTAAVTGAGISVPAGIMAFEGMDFPVVLQMTSLTVLRSAPEHYYKMARKAFLDAMFENGPTLTHKTLAKLEKRGFLHGIVTTNIDCLHTLAGSENIAELQGSFGVNKCLNCGRHNDDVHIWAQGKMPCCPVCGGLMSMYPVYAHTGLFERDVQIARCWLSQAELVLFIGTNGPYSGVYEDVIREDTRIVQINPEKTVFDGMSQLCIREKSDHAFCLLDYLEENGVDFPCR